LTSRSKNKLQLNAVKSILIGLLLFLICILISAFINEAGIINSILEFLLLGEPFLLLVSIIIVPMNFKKISNLKKVIVGSLFIHLLLAYIQKYILRVDTWHSIPLEPPDRIQGVFFLSGAGHVVGGAVSLTFGVYFLTTKTTAPLWLKLVVFLSTIWHILIADAKQVIFTFMVAGILLLLCKLNNIFDTIKYSVIGAFLGLIFLWCMQNLEAFSAFNTWVRPEIYGPQGEATLLKTATFRIVPAHYESILNWLFGLGPGHTVTRLGGWMIGQYYHLLNPLGVTRHIATAEVWQAVGSSWLGSQSSMFSPLFGWAGIWGDLGLLGLASYLYLAWLVWHHLCLEDFSKFLLLTVFVSGLIMSQMEEPGYMLFVATIIGLQWQEKKIYTNKLWHKPV
jgi:hypothetical protein